MENLISKIKTLDSGKVLDVATGNGDFIYFIKEFKSYENILGIDKYEKFEKLFKDTFQENNISFKKMDAYNINFDDEYFDTVCISNSLHHLEEPEKVLKGMLKVLKKGGKLIINEMYSDENLQNNQQKSHILLHHFIANINRIQGIFHNITYKKSELEKFIKDLPLSNIEVIDYAYPVEDPNNEDFINQQIKHLENMLESVKDNKEYNQLKTELEDISLYLKKNGFASASSLFMIGYKR